MIIQDNLRIISREDLSPLNIFILLDIRIDIDDLSISFITEK